MPNVSFVQLVDVEKIRQLLEAQYKITGILSAILDTNENILVAVGWQDVCVRFHRANRLSCAHCRESDAYIKAHLRDFDGGYLDYRCRNGLRDVAVPIVIGGEHLATLFTGQFFYDDEEVDMEFFRAQAERFGFDTESYLEAVSRVPRCSRERIRCILDYYRNLVGILTELGLKNLNLTREVGQRKKAEESLQESRDYLDKILNTIADPVLVKDEKHRMVLVNDAQCALAGATREEMLGRIAADFVPAQQAAVFWRQDQLVLDSEREQINEEEITDAQGQTRIFLAKKALYKDKHGDKYVVGVLRDITDLKETERELRRINEELESRVAARTSELASVNEALRKLNETLEKRVEEEVAKNRAKEMILIQQNRQAALGEMLDQIAHQWKQPINNIYLIAQDLEITATSGELTTSYLVEGVRTTLSLLDHMVQTLDVFRDFYRPDKEKTVFLVKYSLEMARALMGPALIRHGISVEVDAEPELAALGYAREYTQVLLNLLGNCRNVLVERKIETPWVAIRGFREGGKAVVTIVDNGGGIAEGNLDKIFEPYFTTRKAAGGTGVGLYMSKTIIESMGGALSVANADKGALFRIEIPGHSGNDCAV